MITSSTTPVEFRHLVRQGRFTGPTSGVCPGYPQANLVIVVQAYAYDFLLLVANCRNLPRMLIWQLTFRGIGFIKMVNWLLNQRRLMITGRMIL